MVSTQKVGHDAAMRRLKRSQNHLAMTLLPRLKSFVNPWAYSVEWLGVTWLVHHDRIDVMFHPKFGEHLAEEHIAFIRANMDAVRQSLSNCRVKRGRISGAKKMEDDCWMFIPK